MEVKLFWVQSPAGKSNWHGRPTGGNTALFEQEVNGWLAENPDIEIAHVEQSACGGSYKPGVGCCPFGSTGRNSV